MVNRGDSFRRRRSRSNSLAPQHDSSESKLRHTPLNGIAATTASTAPSSALSADSPLLDSYPADDDHHPSNIRTYRSAMIGAHGVGKSALVGQFMTSECINAYCERVRNGEHRFNLVPLNWFQLLFKCYSMCCSLHQPSNEAKFASALHLR